MAVEVMRANGRIRDVALSEEAPRSLAHNTAVRGNVAKVTVFYGEWQPGCDTEPRSTQIAFALGDGMAAAWIDDAVRGLRPGGHVQVPRPGGAVRTVRVDAVHEDLGADGGDSVNGTGAAPSAGAPGASNGGAESLASSDSATAQAERELEALRAEGNRHLTGAKSTFREWRKAVLAYSRALEWVPRVRDPAVAEAKLRLNLALACLKLDKWDVCVLHCDRVLVLDAGSAKAYFRRGSAQFKLGLHEAAHADLREAARLCPDDRRIAAELDMVTSKMFAAVQQGREEFAQVYSKRVRGKIFDKRVS